MSNRPVKLNSACIKTLSTVEARPESSHQHEFNGVRQLKDMFGLDNFELQATFSIRGTNISDTVNVTWYDARASHPIRSEYRLYFQQNLVMSGAQAGDNILIGFDNEDHLHLILIPLGGVDHRNTLGAWEPFVSQ